MMSAFAGIPSLITVNLQFSTKDVDSALKTLRRFKERYGRKIVYDRSCGFPLVGGLEWKNHLHFHGLTQGPIGISPSDFQFKMDRLILGKIPHLHQLGNKFEEPYDVAGWVRYCSKFETENDLAVWI